MKDVNEVTIGGRKLKCTFCGNNQFYEFDVKLNTLSTSFGSGLWSLFAKNAKAFACSKCGLKQEFLKK
ncbi:hypothetical protein ACFLQN_04780 [Candidatus Aenigmatarchaeota archaeon]